MIKIVHSKFECKPIPFIFHKQIVEKLKTLYPSHEDVEITVGGSLESHVAGALAGPTFLCILTEQFYRTRVGDRFFFENGEKYVGFTPGMLYCR